MKSAFIGFAVTASLLVLGVVPGAWSVSPGSQAGFEDRHAAENKIEVETRLGLRGA
jgi:hypothetical protein